MKNHWQFLTNLRSFGAFMHDVVVAYVAWCLSFSLRFNFEIPANFNVHLYETAFWVVSVQVVVFVIFGLYQGVWRFASIPDLKRIIKAVAVAAIAIAALLLMISPAVVVPRTVLILDPILLVLLMGGSRFAYRAWKEHRLYGTSHAHGEPVILIGAGDLAVALLKDLSRSEQWRVVGLLDEDKTMRGRLIMGVRVLGTVEQLPEIATKYDVSHIIIALPPKAHQLRRLAVALANANELTALTVPAVDDLMSGRVSISQIRKVDVEDLLGRETVSLDNQGLQQLIECHTVMVSGAGGSIGSEPVSYTHLDVYKRQIVGTLNADDFYPHESVLEAVAKVFLDPNIEASYGDLVYVSQQDTDKVVRYWKSRGYVTGLFKSGWMPAHPTFFARKSVYDRLGGFDLNYKIAADFELLFRFIEQNKIKTKFLPEVLVKMRLGGTTNKNLSNILKQNKEIVAILNKHYADFSVIKFMFVKLFNRLFQYIFHSQG